MKNRISHLLRDWRPEPRTHESPASGAPSPGEQAPRHPHRPPRSVNMLMPVELCVNRNLLVSLLSASITEMSRHREADPSALSLRTLAEMEAALQQQLAFRAWLKEHPSGYICIALYPVSPGDPLQDPDDLGDPPS